MHSRLSHVIRVGAVIMPAVSATTAPAAFVDLRSVSADLAGSTFTGFLDGVAVTGSATGGLESYTFNAPATDYEGSTINATSPQYSYASVYDPSAPGVDRVGYGAPGGGTFQIAITFGSQVTNPRFHVAELDGAAYTFTLTGGLTSLSLVRGNGGGGDGLQVVGNVVSDTDPSTYFGLDPTTPPPTTGPRSAYGTVSLNGTFSALSITVSAVHGDGGSFTFSSVPEPTAMVVMGAGGLVFLRRSRRTARGAADFLWILADFPPPRR